MIKNIVFDMGNVLVDYTPEEVGRRLIPDEAVRREVCTSVFVSPEWLMLDMGVIREADALTRMQSRLDTEEKRRMAALCLAHWSEYNMRTRKEMETLVRSLKERGFGIYLCSNASLRLLECYRGYLPALECFDGLLFSAEVKAIKPQRELYEHLFRRFQLKPEECFFIDDMELNVKGAEACGMKGYCFADGNLPRLREALERLNG